MGNVSLKEIVHGYEQYIEENGVTEEAVRVYVSAAYVALNELKDHVYLLELTERIKQLIEQLVMNLTGGTIWELEKFAQENMANYELLDQYYEVLKLESFDRFESFIRCMEKQRPWKKRFYQPREKTLHIVADDLQCLEDDASIDFQGISQPSRTGKALAFNTPVLTRNGWKKHGDLTIRDEVIGLDGEFKKILAIHNPCKMEYKVTFSDGEEVICHGNHEWRVHDRNKRDELIDIETKEMFFNYKN